jgi:flagellar basal-body rod protein FlgB
MDIDKLFRNLKAMLNRVGNVLDFHGEALKLRAERGRVLAGNIANADTPGFKARDFDFGSALQAATGTDANGKPAPAAADSNIAKTTSTHRGLLGAEGQLNLKYRLPQQVSIDGNSVEMDNERAQFAENAIKYESTLRFLNGQIKTMMSAIKGE